MKAVSLTQSCAYRFASRGLHFGCAGRGVVMPARDCFSAAMALGLILGLSTAQASSANPIATVTYTGQATNIFDPTGLFGVPSSDLFSAAFVNVFTVDLSKGQLNHYNFGGIAEDQLLGGSFYG